MQVNFEEVIAKSRNIPYLKQSSGSDLNPSYLTENT